MKRIYFILFAILSFWQSQAQESLPYKAKAMFKADTLQYLEYNFTARTSQYKGKKVSEVLSELEFPVLYIVEWSVADDLQNGSKLRSLSLAIRQMGDKPNPLFDYYIMISFKNPPSFSEFRKTFQPTGRIEDIYPKFTPQIYEFIKDLEVSGVGSNPYIIMKRENDLKKAEAQKSEEAKD
jgi:hypothetical protein